MANFRNRGDITGFTDDDHLTIERIDLVQRRAKRNRVIARTRPRHQRRRFETQHRLARKRIIGISDHVQDRFGQPGFKRMPTDRRADAAGTAAQALLIDCRPSFENSHDRPPALLIGDAAVFPLVLDQGVERYTRTNFEAF